MYLSIVTQVTKARLQWFWAQPRFATTVVSLATFKTTILKDRRIKMAAGTVRAVEMDVIMDGAIGVAW